MESIFMRLTNILDLLACSLVSEARSGPIPQFSHLRRLESLPRRIVRKIGGGRDLPSYVRNRSPRISIPRPREREAGSRKDRSVCPSRKKRRVHHCGRSRTQGAGRLRSRERKPARPEKDEQNHLRCTCCAGGSFDPVLKVYQAFLLPPSLPPTRSSSFSSTSSRSSLFLPPISWALCLFGYHVPDGPYSL